MTQAIVVRMPPNEVAALDAIARARKTNRSAIVRQATQRFVNENKDQKGAGWPERLKELRRLSREAGHKPVKRNIVAEIRAIDQDGAWPL